MALSRILGAASLAVVALALVSVALNWSDGASTAESEVVVGDASGESSDAPSPSVAPTTTSGDGATVDGSAPPAATTAPAAPATTTTVPAPTAAPHVDLGRAAELVFTGDIIPAARVGEMARFYGDASGQRYDFEPMFERVAGEIAAADLAICHLDTTVALDGVVSGGGRHEVPDAMATALVATGWDGCSMASWNAFDRGAEGVAGSIAAMDSAGLGHAGLAADPAGQPSVARYDAGGIAIAHLSYTEGVAATGLEEAPHAVALIDVEAIVDAATRSRIDGAQFVVVSLHWGNQFDATVTETQLAVATSLADSGAVDLVIGHGAHLMQPVDRIGSMWVAYGIGNFLTNHSPGCCPDASEDGVVLHVDIADTADAVEVVGVAFTPTWTDRVQMQVMPVEARLQDPGLQAWYRAVLRRAYDRTLDALTSFGADELGVAPTGTVS